MRTIRYIFFLLVLFSCKKNEQAPDYNSDKSRLTHLTDSLTQVYDNAVEGNKPGNYSEGAREALKAALDLAAQVESKPFTQESVNNAYNNLLLAAQQFNTKLIQEVSAEYLVAYWKFNGNAADSSGHGHDGMLKTGYVGSSAATAADGGVLPQLTTDRFGRADMAYSFNNGAMIQVPYATELNPPSFSISLWVNMTANTANSYMFSLDRWNGFKFNLNGTAVPFLTVSVSNTIYDRDAGGGNVSANTWTHLAVSYTDGTMKFYVNGDLLKTWTNTPGAALTLASPVDLAIGNEMPKQYYNLTDNSNPNYFWGASYFIGSMDDIRFYKTTLTDAEVHSIYINEKTL
ncbi:LamG domain-containing protein [Flavitalea sp. BT771]|uniref:LamG domain-containing protein n=1 Tax=Flavitalea sp. BT771 TaxID=3063329 RepID=UPI0026E38841|nr:LamG domain-containing protein [Flavitalea sp. BT771]MDO6430664.1 LamG domain-containing protein [Flavitalea sp. BT771]MDV6219196.1 LamG domain-containing protein [Flavitalea sp. BT771]